MGELLKTDQDRECRVIRELRLVSDHGGYRIRETDFRTKKSRISKDVWSDPELAREAYRRGTYQYETQP